MKEFACGAVVPGCAATFEGETVSDILEQVAVHAREDHDMETIPPEVAAQVEQNINDR
jgi:predicted small metal-binding protein